MTMFRHKAAADDRRGWRAVLAVVAVALAAPALAQGPPPRAAVAGKAATFLPPLGLWDDENRAVRMLFPGEPVPPDVEALARSDGGWRADGRAPLALVELYFAAGKDAAAPADIDGCRIDLVGLSSDVLEIEGETAKDCHVISTGGRLQPGGMLMGLIEGNAKGYDLRLPFVVSFPKPAQ